MPILSQDPRYLEFVRRYADDPCRFAVEVLGSTPTWQQVELYDSVAPFGSRTSVSSGHGCFAAGTMVMMADGSHAAVEDIKAGDQLMAADGRSARMVLELRRGREAMHRLTYGDGSSHTFNESHILCLVSPDGTVTKETVSQWLSWGTEQRGAYEIYRLSRPATETESAHYRLLSIASAEALGDGEYYGFVLDGDGRFLAADGTVLHNTGKTYGYAALCAWHLICYPGSNTYLHAPKLKTLQEGVWQELSKIKTALASSAHAWLNDHFIVETERVYIKGAKMEWFVTCRVAPIGKPESLAGTHAKHLMWLVDEASGVPDANFGVIGGAMTDERNRFVLASQPTRPSGFFRETQHTLNRENGGSWNALVFNSEDSPLVSDQFILDKQLEYGGRDSPEYQIKVCGTFPEYSDKYLLSRGMIDRRVNAPRTIEADEPFGNLLIIDVAAGVYRDKTVALHAKVRGYGDRLDADPRRMDVIDIPVFSNSLDWQEVAGRVRDVALQLSNCTVLVDAGGQGIQFAKMLTKLDVPNVVKVYWGNPCFLKRNKQRFINLRAQCSVHAADAVKDGRITFPDKYKKELLDQGSRIPFYFGDKGEWHIMSKVDMAKEGIPSPDLWDTVCMAFLEDARYITDESSEAPDTTGTVEEARAAAQSAFADA